MTPITQQEIDVMRANGYDLLTIREAEDRLALYRKGEIVAETIRSAFAGVRLGDGVGLHEGQALDDYADAETRTRYRAEDEKESWERLPLDALNNCYSSLSFFDADGMRFHLPAFMIADLRGEYGQGLTFHLTALSDLNLEQFACFTPAQRQAVRAFLCHIRDDPDYEFEQTDIDRALRDYWIESDPAAK